MAKRVVERLRARVSNFLRVNGRWLHRVHSLLTKPHIAQQKNHRVAAVLTIAYQFSEIIQDPTLRSAPDWKFYRAAKFFGIKLS